MVSLKDSLELERQQGGVCALILLCRVISGAKSFGQLDVLSTFAKMFFIRGKELIKLELCLTQG